MIFLFVVWTIGILIWLAWLVTKCNLPRITFSFPVAGLVVVVAGSVIGFEFFHIPAAIPITIDRVLLGLLLLTFGCLLIRSKLEIRRPIANDYLVIGLMAILLISAFSGDWSYLNNRPVSRFIFYYALPICLYFLVKNCHVSDGELKIIAFGFCGFCLYLALTAVAEWRGQYWLVYPAYINDPTVAEFFGRGRGPFLNPVSNGVFMTTGVIVAIIIWWNSEMRIRSVLTVAIPILLIGNLATLTRSVWLAAATCVGIVVWTITNRRQRALLIVAGTVAAVTILATIGPSMVNFKRDKFVSRNEMAQSAQLRPIFAVIAWEMFQDNPLRGCGLGRYNKYKADYFKSPQSTLQLSKAKPYLQHNVVLSLLTETGLIGCGLFLILIGHTYYFSIRLFRSQNASQWSRSYALVLIALVTCYLINGMFHDVSIIPMSHVLLFFMLGIGASLYQSNCIERTPTIVPIQVMTQFQQFLRMRINKVINA